MLSDNLSRFVTFCKRPTRSTFITQRKRTMSSEPLKSTGLKPIIFAGPSGVGKGTIIEMLKAEFPGKVGHSVSHTTRQPRVGEEDGKAYHFVTPEKFQELVDLNKFVETAKVHTNRYGTTFDAVSAVTSTGKLCLLDLDVQGCQTVRKVGFPAYLVFIQPPSMDLLEERLRKRGTEDEAAIQVRLQTAQREMTFANDPIWDKVITNDKLVDCYAQIKAIINEMEHGFLDQ